MFLQKYQQYKCAKDILRVPSFLKASKPHADTLDHWNSNQASLFYIINILGIIKFVFLDVVQNQETKLNVQKFHKIISLSYIENDSIGDEKQITSHVVD